MQDIASFKAQVRAILLALGRRATEAEFRKMYHELEGHSINNVLKEFGHISFYDLMKLLPDVCTVSYSYDGQIFMQRVTDQATQHMDRLTIVKKKKKAKKPIVGYSSFGYRPFQVKPIQRQQSIAYFHQNRSFAPPSYSPPIYRPVPSVPSQNGAFTSLGQEKLVFRPKEANSSPSNEKISSATPVTEVKSSAVKPINSMTSVKSVTSLTSVKQPSKSPSLKPSLGNERAVYRQTERIIFEGDKTRIEVKQSNDTWTDIENTKPNDNNLNLSIKDEQLDNLDDNNSFTIQNSERSVKVDNNQELKITIQNHNHELKTEDYAPKGTNPRNLRIANRSKLFQRTIDSILVKKMEKVVIRNSDVPQVSDYLQSFITDEHYRIPKPTVTNENSSFFRILLIDTVSPTNFTFQFGFNELLDFSKKMRDLYGSFEYPSHYRVKKFIKGMYVAVQRGEYWYRSYISNINGEEISVIPIDCMKLHCISVKPKDIFYLHKSFSTQSQKSVTGCIFGIKPLEGIMWSPECLKIMKDLPRKWTATVRTVKDNVYHINIVDVENKQNFVDILSKKKLVTIDPNAYADRENLYFKSLK